MDSSDPAPMDEVRAPAAVPPVEVVVVAHEPGDWFHETLNSVAAQDYAQWHLTVVTAASHSAAEDKDDDEDEDADLASRVHAVIPDASIVEIDGRFGEGRWANAMLEREVKPAFYLFCGDDVALAPDALRLLVEEALRSNASIAGPKLVDWDRPQELVDVGLDVDKLGHAASRVEPGELDQEQHDAVLDIFAVSGAVQLIRADLFGALDGFDAEMGPTRKDIDFCWRSHVAGARVMVVPSAVARHRREELSQASSRSVQRFEERDRIRTICSVYGVAHSIRVLPQAIVYSALRALGALVTGHFSTARAAVTAWGWNMGHPGPLWQRRSLLRQIRKVPDREIRGLQVRGFVPVTHFLRDTFVDEGGGSMAARARNVLRSLKSGPSRVSLGFWAVAAALFAFGSRHLITRGVPVIGDLVPFDQGPSELFTIYFDNWWATGTGHEAAAPTASGLLGLLGVVFLGFMGLLRTVLTVGMLPVGAVGMWRLLRPFASPWIRVVGTMMYLATPVPYNALANGVWSGLLLFGLLPWVLAGLGRAARVAPYGRLGGPVGEGLLEAAWPREVLALALPVAVLGAFVPFTWVIVAAMVVAIGMGSLLAGWPGGTPRMAAVTASALAVAVLLNLPWLADAASGGLSWDWITGTRSSHPPRVDLTDLLRFDTGPVGGSALGWALPVAGLVPLLLARGPRWAWAVRGLCLYLASIATLWAAGEGWVPFPLPRPETVLAVGGLGLALSAAMGVAAIERDLRTYRFGWRQLAPVTAAVAVILAVVPVVAATFPGDFDMPGNDFNRHFAQQPEPDAPQRVLWIGHDDVLAVGGRRLDIEGLTVAVSADVESSLMDRWAGTPEPADEPIVEALELAFDGGTSRLGRLLAPFGIGEIVLLERLAPAPARGLRYRVPAGVVAALTEQLDLAELDVSPGVTRYRNTSALPITTVTAAGATAGVTLRDYAAGAPAPVQGWLEPLDQRRTEFLGSADTSQEVYAAVPIDTSWRLQVGDRIASKSAALEWAVAFAPVSSGDALLRHQVGDGHRVLMSGQALLWLLAAAAVLRMSGRSREQR